MNLQAERELFESYFKTIWDGIDLIQTIGEDCAFRIHQQNYVEEIVQSHWKTWLASRNREGYVLMPVVDLTRITADTTDINTYEDLSQMIKEAKNEEN